MTLDMSIAEAMRGQVTSEYQSGHQSGGAPTELRLHFAITAGDVSRVILGDPQSRLDYCVHGAYETEDFLRLFIDPTMVRSLDVKRAATLTRKATGEALNVKRSATVTRTSAAEFRPVSIVFISLLFPFNLARVQSVILCFMKSLDLFGGVYQQYAVDDKGQTLLAVFGLSV
ncbi:hypothetical protein HK101_004691, partial [Irineochytrium annulatum]